MPRRLELKLSTKQREQLEDMRDHANIAYLRERAAALLKIADGHSARQVASQGLLRTRWHRTLGYWVERFNEQGIDGLKIRAGRGRKPTFSPSIPRLQ